MAIIKTYTGIPSSRRMWYTINYPWLQDDEAILTLATTVMADIDADDEALPDFTVNDKEIDDDNKRVRLLMGGGLGHYIVAVVIDTSLQQRSRDCLEFYIDEDC